MEKPACLYPTVSDKTDAGRPQENEHQQRGGRTLDNSEYPFEIGAAAPSDENEYLFKIGAAALIYEIENSFDKGAATLIGEIENPFKIEAAASILKGFSISPMRIPLK